MSVQLAFVGDVHGNLDALKGLWESLKSREPAHVVFLGDYINKGPQSAEVIDQLLSYASGGRATLLAGNHETALLDAIDSGLMGGFLKMGGAMTVRSYVGRPVGPDVLADLLANLPKAHLQALRRMPTIYETDELVACHAPSRAPTAKFRISAHVPVGLEPRIGSRSAELDTGCGVGAGRLTALLWPRLDYVQVGPDGGPVG